MNLKNLPHAIAALLLFLGIIITSIGIGIMSQQIPIFDPSSPSDGAIPELFNMIIGGIITLAGGIFTIFLIITWAFATLVQLFGVKVLYNTLAIIVLIPAGYYLNYLLEIESTPEKTILVGTVDGIIYSRPTFDSPVDTLLNPESDYLTILKDIDSDFKGYPWFKVSYAGSRTGYIWGGNLCALEEWVNGIGSRCLSHQSDTLYSELFRYTQDTASNAAEIVEFVHYFLPGVWSGLPGKRTESNDWFKFNEKKEILNRGEIIGWWAVEIVRKESGYPDVFLRLKYLPEFNYLTSRLEIVILNFTSLHLADSRQEFIHLRYLENP